MEKIKEMVKKKIPKFQKSCNRIWFLIIIKTCRCALNFVLTPQLGCKFPFTTDTVDRIILNPQES